MIINLVFVTCLLAVDIIGILVGTAGEREILSINFCFEKLVSCGFFVAGKNKERRSVKTKSAFS